MVNNFPSRNLPPAAEPWGREHDKSVQTLTGQVKSLQEQVNFLNNQSRSFSNLFSSGPVIRTAEQHVDSIYVNFPNESNPNGAIVTDPISIDIPPGRSRGTIFVHLGIKMQVRDSNYPQLSSFNPRLRGRIYGPAGDTPLGYLTYPGLNAYFPVTSFETPSGTPWVSLSCNASIPYSLELPPGSGGGRIDLYSETWVYPYDIFPLTAEDSFGNNFAFTSAVAIFHDEITPEDDFSE